MTTDSERTPTRPRPAAHVESGQKQFESTLRNLLRDELKPLADSMLSLDARVKAQDRAIASVAIGKLLVPTIALVIALAGAALSASNLYRVLHYHPLVVTAGQ